jgi:hypothetical protein
VAQPIAIADAGRPAPVRKHLILYSLQNWKDTRLLLGVLAVGYVGLGIFQYSQPPHRIADIVVSAVAVAFALLAIPLMYAYTRQNYLRLDDDSFRVQVFFRSVTVPYTEVEKVRVDTVEKVFERPENSKRRTKLVQKLYKQRALVIKLRDDGGAPELLLKRFGGRTMMDHDLVLPVTDIDLAYTTLKDRLVERRGRAIATTSARTGRKPRRRR